MSSHGFYRMPFGRYRGCALLEIPTNYLVWVIEKSDITDIDVRRAIRAELAWRFTDASGRTLPTTAITIPSSLTTPVTSIIKHGVRDLARQHHPDVGGDPETMRAILAARDWLNEQVRK